jgi:hypothetical protein
MFGLGRRGEVACACRAWIASSRVMGTENFFCIASQTSSIWCSFGGKFDGEGDE